MRSEHHQGTVQPTIQPVETRRERARLIGFVGLMLVAGWALAAVGGTPRWPAELPTWGELATTLSGSTLPLEPLALAVVDATWLLWIWIAGSLGLELLLVLAEAIAHGAAWVGSLRAVADRLSVPMVRRAVAAAFAVQLLSRGVTVAAAQPLSSVEATLVVASATEPGDSGSGSVQASPSSPTYTVRAGDTLWSIAEGAYGSGSEYRRLIEANVGRRMADGLVFSAQGVIHPGWDLVVPEPLAAFLEQEDDDSRYTVRPGDTLSSIAARQLDDQARWFDLFELNRGATTPDGRHVLEDANVIWPGLRLSLVQAGTPAPDAANESSEVVERTETDDGPTRTADLVAASAGVSQPHAAPAEDPASAPAEDPAAAVDDRAVGRAENATAATEDRAVGPAEDRAVGPAEDPVSARAENADPAPAEDPAAVPLADPSATSDLPPLVRTPHTLDPVVLEPAATSDASPPAAEAAPSAWGDRLPIMPMAAGGLGLAALAGVAIGARRLRRLRPLPQEPESEVVVEGGFAEAQLAQDFTRGIHGAGFDPVAALVGQLETFLREYDLASAGVIAVQHGRSATTLTLKASLAEQALLVDLAPVFAERIQADVEAWVSVDQDVVLRLSGLRRTRLLPTAESAVASPCLVPLGVLYDRQVYSAAWNGLGHVLVASLPGHGADTILTGLVATLTARRSPEAMRLWIVGSPRSLPAVLFDVPHLVRVVDPSDGAALGRAADDLRLELDRRAAADDLVVVVPELTSLAEHAPSFELLIGGEADTRVRLVAATCCPDLVVSSPLLSRFGTRMVLRMQEEEASVALLGVADAAFLGGGGRLLLRLDGREPLELYGHQVPAEHLERLVRVMRSAYPAGGPPGAAARVPQARPDASAQRAPEPESVDAMPASDSQVQALTAPHGQALTAPQGQTLTAPQGQALTALQGQALTALQGEALTALQGQALTALQGEALTAPHGQTLAALQDQALTAPQAEAVTAPQGQAFTAPQGEESPPADGGQVDAPQAAGLARPREVVVEAPRAARDNAQLATAEVGVLAPSMPPVQVNCFGAPRVLCAGTPVWPRPAGGDAKPWELLLYLACQPPEGVSRESAVEALWPEDDAEDAPHRFRQLRYRLRRALNAVAGAPDTDGICLERGVLRLDPDVVYSDAREFLALARRARITPGMDALGYLEQARSLYVDDLLVGPEARRYAWLDERDPSGVTLREHFRRQYHQACVRLAQLYASAGDLGAAVELYRELTESDPGDERLWLALFQVHARRRDRLALVREEQRMREALRDLSGDAPADEPSFETSQEFERLVAGLHDRDRQPVTA